MIGESRVIGGAAILVCFLANSFKDSRCWSYLSGALDFLENSLFDSHLFRAYRKVAVGLGNAAIWGKVPKIDTALKEGWVAKNLFNPLFIFPAVYLAVLGLSTYRVSNLALFSILFGVLFFSGGALASGRLSFKARYSQRDAEKATALLLSLGLFCLSADLFRAGNIPLFHPEVRRNLSVLYTMGASLLVPGGILAISLVGAQTRSGKLGLREARVHSIALVIAITGLISLLGYRTQTVVSLLGCAFAMYASGIIGLSEIVMAFLGALFGISWIGHMRAATQGAATGLSGVIGSRLGLTLSVYDLLLHRFWPLGVNRGYTLLATFSSFLWFVPGPRLGPRTIVARMVGIEKNISITSTLLGTVILDFGIVGIALFMLALGFVLGSSYRAANQTRAPVPIAVYSLLLAYSLVGIETGLVDFNVALFFVAGFVLVMSLRE